jgi:hypothetical protein
MTYYQLRSKFKRGFLMSEVKARKKAEMECCLMITLKDTILRFDYDCDIATYQKELVRQYMADRIIEKAFEMVANG